MRSSEIIAIVDALRNFDDELKIQLFGAGGGKSRVDMNELVLCGHSFGGCTMIESANKL